MSQIGTGRRHTKATGRRKRGGLTMKMFIAFREEAEKIGPEGAFHSGNDMVLDLPTRKD